RPPRRARPPRPARHGRPLWPAEAVARVGEAFLTGEELRAASRRSGGADVTNALETLVRRELYFLEAQRTGFGDREDVRAAWRAFLASRYEEARLAAREPSAALTGEDLARYYEAHREEYLSPERRRLAILFLPLPASADAAQRTALEAQARTLHDQAVAEAGDSPGLGNLAARHSAHRPSRLVGGDVGWMTRAQASRAWAGPVVDAAFALTQPAEVSPPIATEDGWYLVKLIEQQPAQAPPWDQVQDRLRYELTRARAAEAREAELAELRARHPVEIRPDRLAQVQVAWPDGRAVAGRHPDSQPPSLPAP
ncbi:MAG: peptidyl-prolyl cis-trans isomerase, partial [Verrucomicrobiae bacterium]|nr:peptidyl-prolyl cis-trans isomerase [Verrucomicrobiae bacterium]